MTYAEHRAAAERFLQAASLLQSAGTTMLAAEAVWGAAVQAIDALSHGETGSARHAGNNHDRAEILEQLGESHLPTETLSQGFTAVKDKLHNHFYTGRLAEWEVEANLRIGFDFVNGLLELADKVH